MELQHIIQAVAVTAKLFEILDSHCPLLVLSKDVRRLILSRIDLHRITDSIMEHRLLMLIANRVRLVLALRLMSQIGTLPTVAQPTRVHILVRHSVLNQDIITFFLHNYPLFCAISQFQLTRYTAQSYFATQLCS